MSGDGPKLISVRMWEPQSLPAHSDDQNTFGWLVFPRTSGAQESGRAPRQHDEAPCWFFELGSCRRSGRCFSFGWPHSEAPREIELIDGVSLLKDRNLTAIDGSCDAPVFMADEKRDQVNRDARIPKPADEAMPEAMEVRMR